MKERELEAKVMRFVREIGIAPQGKVRTVGFDLTRGVVVLDIDGETYVSPAAGAWSDYADNVARIRQATTRPADQEPRWRERVACPGRRASSG